MSWRRTIPILLAIAALVAASVLLRRPGVRQASAIPTDRSDLADVSGKPVDPAAEELLARAADRHAGPAAEWLRTAVWLRARLPGLAYEAEGAYVRAPDQRYRLDLRARIDAARSPRRGECVVVSVSDGKDRWQATRTGRGPWRGVRRQRLDGPLEEADGPARLPRGQTMHGPGPLLHSLQTHIRWVRRETRGQEVRLIGAWKPEVIAEQVPAGQAWPAALPRLCRLTLRSADLWPARVEWWGPTADGDTTNRLLVEMEFRDPVRGQGLSAAECARTFTFDPGDAAVEDVRRITP